MGLRCYSLVPVETQGTSGNNPSGRMNRQSERRESYWARPDLR